MFKKNYNGLTFILIFLTLSILLYFIIQADKIRKENEYLTFVTDKYTVAYNTIYEKHLEIAETLYLGIVTRYKITELYKQLQTATDKEKDALRAELLSRVGKRYSELRNIGIRQLHFHLKNNTSFLRMHRPAKYGDNLTNIRHTIMMTNRTQKMQHGFESGRIFDGYRYVFPITAEDGTHMGSMEISFAPSAFTAAMMKQYVVLSNFYIKEKVLQEVVFKDEFLSNYKKSHHPGYLFDKSVLQELKKVTSKDMTKLKPSKDITDKIYANAHTGKNMSIAAPDIHAIFTTIPIMSHDKKYMAAFFTVRSEDHYIEQIDKSSFRLFLLGMLAIGLSMYIMYIQKKANIRMNKVTSELELIFNNSFSGIFWVGEGRFIQRANQRAADILGYDSPSELEGVHASLVHLSEEKNLDFQERFYNSLVNSQIKSIEFEIKKKDGTTIWVLVSGKAIDDNIPADLSKGVLWTIDDLSIRKTLEKKLISEKEKFEKLFRYHSAIMFIVDPVNGDIVDVNKATIDFYGFSYAEMINMTIYDINTMNKNDINNKMSHVLDGQTKSFVFEHKKKDGTRINVETFSTSIMIEGETLLFSIVHDITQKVKDAENIKKYQEELEQLNKHLNERAEEEASKRIAQELIFKQIFNSLDSFVSLVDRDYRYVIANKTYCEVFNINEKDLIGKHVSHIITEAQFEKSAKPMLDKALAGETHTIESYIPLKNDEKIHVEITFCPFIEDDEIKGAIVSSKNITEKHLLKKELQHKEYLMIQQSKLADMGSMIAAIAHQWKQPLNIILLSTDYYRTEHEDDHDADELYDCISEQVNYLSETINDFRNFFSPSKTKRKFLLHDSIKQVLRMLTPKMKTQNISIEVEAEDTVRAYGYQNEFMQVMINIINNSRDAILKTTPQAGLIRIKIAKKGSMAFIQVMDNGGGIPAELLPDKLFEAYTTTKGDQGTGIGLSMAKTIIEKYMEGQITAANEGEGAVFSISLPASYTRVNVTEDMSNTSILYVEDDQFTLDSVSTLLKKKFKNVYKAINGSEGLDIYNKNQNDISLVITDIDMPVMNGVEMSKAIRNISPEIPIFVVTAIRDDVYEDVGFNGILEKPINSQRLYEMLDTLK